MSSTAYGMVHQKRKLRIVIVAHAVSVSQSDSQSNTEANTPLQQKSEVLNSTTSEANSESTAVAGDSAREQLAQLLVSSSNSKEHSSSRDKRATSGNSWQELRVELARRSAIGGQQELMPSLIWQLKEAAEKRQQTTIEVKAEIDSVRAESPIAGTTGANSSADQVDGSIHKHCRSRDEHNQLDSSRADLIGSIKRNTFSADSQQVQLCTAYTGRWSRIWEQTELTPKQKSTNSHQH